MSNNTILLKTQGLGYRIEEETASEAITPGHLVELVTSSGRKTRKHATEGGYAERTFALEDPLQGKTAFSVESRTIDDAYAADEKVQVGVVAPGCKVWAWLKAGENVALNAQLISAGDGTLIAAGSISTGGTVQQIVAIAEEALDLSASGAVDTRIKVRVL